VNDGNFWEPVRWIIPRVAIVLLTAEPDRSPELRLIAGVTSPLHQVRADRKGSECNRLVPTIDFRVARHPPELADEASITVRVSGGTVGGNFVRR